MSYATDPSITPWELLDLACFCSMTYKQAAVIFALRAITEFREGVDNPCILTAARSLISVLEPTARV